ncbi:expressed unknown protein [Seminavis robusta]|uniref:Uncharacterized protein n=1 Tax=Seminavis robusta TaxID=568900 RepID=A0A9N8DEH5_9STRA|nr:expressed unknown protein [Seminavis robusta]|eukprot:Sro81_g043380.1 n/a (545) ;mRNA; f:25210-26844
MPLRLMHSKKSQGRFSLNPWGRKKSTGKFRSFFSPFRRHGSRNRVRDAGSAGISTTVSASTSRETGSGSSLELSSSRSFSSVLRNRTKSSLELAVEHDDFSPEELDDSLYLFERDGHLHPSFKASGPTMILDLPQATLLGRILPHVTMMEIQPQCYTPAGLKRLLEILQDKHATRHLFELRLLQLPSDWIAANTDLFAQTLKALLTKEKPLYPLKILKLSLRQPDCNANHPTPIITTQDDDDAICFHTIQQAFAQQSSQSPQHQHTSSLTELELEDFYVPSNCFLDLLANAGNPSLLRIRRFRITSPDDNDNDNDTTSMQNWQEASLQRLALTGCAIASDCVTNVLDGIGALPELEHLTLSAWKHVDHNTESAMLTLGGYNYESMEISRVVIPLLQRNKIASISSATAYVNVETLVPALQRNRSLQILELLGRAGSPSKSRTLSRGGQPDTTTNEEDACLLQILQEANTTLQQVPRITSPLVQYYVSLNASGRTQARSVDTTRSAFVEVLAKVNETTKHNRHHFQTHAILHGLLMENPNLWSGY